MVRGPTPTVHEKEEPTGTSAPQTPTCPHTPKPQTEIRIRRWLALFRAHTNHLRTYPTAGQSRPAHPDASLSASLPGQWREVVTCLRWPSSEDPHRNSGMGPSGWREHYYLLSLPAPASLCRAQHEAQTHATRSSAHTSPEADQLPHCTPGDGSSNPPSRKTSSSSNFSPSPSLVKESSRTTAPSITWSPPISRSGTRVRTASRGIPTDLGHLLWQALTDVQGVEHVRADLASELATPPSLGEFNGIIAGHRGSTTPGATGLTYNMVQEWPAPVRTFAHHCLVELWGQPITPSWLEWGWLCPKPKDPEAEVTLDGLKPLILLEVLRKLWVGIIIGRITRAWERHRVLADAQHGFRPGRGTDAALIQFINAREHAEEAAPPPALLLELGHPKGLRLGPTRRHGNKLDSPRRSDGHRPMACHHGRGGAHSHTLPMGPPNLGADCRPRIRNHPLPRQAMHLPSGPRHPTR